MGHINPLKCACDGVAGGGGRWVQAECRRLGDADAPEVEELLQRGARALRQRSVLFRYCAEEVAAARHGALFQRGARASAPR